jgi:predicted naringenin-chalcone synthase
VTTTALGVRAARAALDAAKVEPSALDLIVLATSTPDQIFPSTACLVQANSARRARRPSTCRRCAAGSSTAGGGRRDDPHRRLSLRAGDRRRGLLAHPRLE